jgi:hypothetical protein
MKLLVVRMWQNFSNFAASYFWKFGTDGVAILLD